MNELPRPASRTRHVPTFRRVRGLYHWRCGCAQGQSLLGFVTMREAEDEHMDHVIAKGLEAQRQEATQ